MQEVEFIQVSVVGEDGIEISDNVQIFFFLISVIKVEKARGVADERRGTC